MAADVLPRTTKTDPWDLVAAFSEQLGKQNLYAEKDARAAQQLPVEQALAIAKMRAAKEMGLEFLPQELELKDTYDARSAERTGDITRRNMSAQGDREVDVHKRKLGTEQDIYKVDPDFFTRGRLPAEKTPDIPPGWDGIMMPGDVDKALGQKPGASSKTPSPYSEIGDPIIFNGKQYYPYKKKKDGQNTPNTVGSEPAQPETLPSTGKTNPIARPGYMDPAAKEKLLQENDRATVKKSSYESPGPSDNLISEVYDSLRTKGLSHGGAIAMMGEVGRENNFDPSLIFGNHSDPHNRVENAGLISWQGGRRQQLLAKLQSEGLLGDDGKIIPSKATLDSMTGFMHDEMPEQLRSYLASDEVDPQTAARQIGKNFIRWRYDDPRYASGHRNRDDWRSRSEELVNSKRKPQVQATANPDIFDVVLGDNFGAA